MSTITQVQPGDLITADLMNQILSRLAQIDAIVQQLGGSGAPTITVPTVYGRLLAEARAIIGVPTLQLNLGSVIDTGGTTVNPNLPQSANLIVVSQMPPPGTRVPPQTSVDLLVASTGGSAQPTPLPTINSITQSSAPVNGQVDIFGANFASLFTANTVRFDGTIAAVSPLSNTQHLIVTVPSTIPGAPTTQGQPAKNGVQVTVTTPAGTSQTPGTITVTAPVPNTPAITSTNPAPPNPAIVNGSLTIIGSNFSTTANQDIVTIGGLAANVTNASATSLTVTVPLVSGLNTIPSTRDNVPVVVTVNGNASNAAMISVTRLN
jgi:hypothetical protein